MEALEVVEVVEEMEAVEEWKDGERTQNQLRGNARKE